MYDRSGTVMDRVSEFFPRGRLSGLGQDFFSWEWGGQSTAQTGWTYDEYGDLVPAAGTVYTQSGSISPTPPEGAQLESVVSTIRQLLLTGQQFVAQQRIIDLNMQRARVGLSPLPASYFQPSVGVGLTPQAQEQLFKVALIGGAGLLAFMVLGGKRRGK